MSRIEFICPRCGLSFERIVMRGDPATPIACPSCEEPAAPADHNSQPLFDGIAGFSDLARDTN